jgi:hypothetical protein
LRETWNCGILTVAGKRKWPASLFAGYAHGPLTRSNGMLEVIETITGILASVLPLPVGDDIM